MMCVPGAGDRLRPDALAGVGLVADGVALCRCGARGCAGLAGATGVGAGLLAAVLRWRPAAASPLRLSRRAALSLSGPLALPLDLYLAVAAPLRLPAVGAPR